MIGVLLEHYYSWLEKSKEDYSRLIIELEKEGNTELAELLQKEVTLFEAELEVYTKVGESLHPPREELWQSGTSCKTNRINSSS